MQQEQEQCDKDLKHERSMLQMTITELQRMKNSAIMAAEDEASQTIRIDAANSVEQKYYEQMQSLALKL